LHAQKNSQFLLAGFDTVKKKNLIHLNSLK
jgi:hypothetical protein